MLVEVGGDQLKMLFVIYHRDDSVLREQMHQALLLLSKILNVSVELINEAQKVRLDAEGTDHQQRVLPGLQVVICELAAFMQTQNPVCSLGCSFESDVLIGPEVFR